MWKTYLIKLQHNQTVVYNWIAIILIIWRLFKTSTLVFYSLTGKFSLNQPAFPVDGIALICLCHIFTGKLRESSKDNIDVADVKDGSGSWYWPLQALPWGVVSDRINSKTLISVQFWFQNFDVKTLVDPAKMLHWVNQSESSIEVLQVFLFIIYH